MTMKKLITSMILLLFSIISFAQTPVKPKLTYKDAGDQMLKHSRHYYIGTGLALGGFLTLTTSPLMNMRYKTRVTVYGIGTTMLLTGTFFLIESHSHLGKAGRILRNMEVGPDGFTYKF